MTSEQSSSRESDGGPTTRTRPPAASESATRPPWPRAVLAITVAAVVLRLLLLSGRGDYLAFDEGFYLLLARSLFTGDGYSLVGIPHVALSPLFPLLAGALGTLIDSWAWAGRIVAAVSSGLLVLPAWAIFRRLAPERTALIATGLVAVLPSMAPFVVPFWIGADLWVGAEPLLHLFLYTGVAAWLWADQRGGLTRWAGVGAAFGLAFLARPEAIATWGLLGLAALAIALKQRSLQRFGGAALMGLVFLAVASPYWIYLHDVTEEWSLTGRGVSPVSVAVQAASRPDRGGAASTIERMLWADDEEYERRLYSLDETGLRLASTYWGVYQEPAPEGPRPPAQSLDEGEADSGGEVTGTPRVQRDQPQGPSTLLLYFRSLNVILPLLLWPFVILGVAQPRSRATLRREVPVALSLLGTSIAIAALVAVDPRTQLLLVPLLAFYAARGFSLVEQQIQQRSDGAGVRPGLVEALLAGVAVVWMLGINGERLYRSLAYGSPHHIVAEQNRAVAEELDVLTGSDEGPVMSWHPALAVYADRDWRVLPHTGLADIIRYAGAAGAQTVVLSAYYPPDLGVEEAGVRYLVLDVPEGAEEVEQWNLRIEPGDSIRTVGRLEAAGTD